MIRQAHSLRQNSLRGGAEKIRSNFLQSTKDQEDVFSIANRQDDTIYQHTKTIKNSTLRQISQVEDREDYWNDFESFVGNREELGRSIDHNSVHENQFKIYSSKDSSVINNQEEHYSPNSSHKHHLTMQMRVEQIIEADKSIQNTFSSANSNEGIKLQKNGSSQNNKSELGASSSSQDNKQADSPVTLQNKHSLYQSQCKKSDDMDLDRFSGLLGAWKKKPFIIITKVKQFIIQIKKYSQSLKFQQMEKQQFDLLNDQSADFKYYYMNDLVLKEQTANLSKWSKLQYSFNMKTNSYLKNKKTLSYLIDILKSGVIDPYSRKLLVWQLFFFFQILWQIIYIPFFISFSSKSDTHSAGDLFLEVLLKYFLPITLYIDIVFNFISAYYSKGQLILNRRQIIARYIKKGTFVIDISIATIFFINASLNIQYLNYFIFAKAYRLSEILSNIEERINLRYKHSSLVDLLNLVSIILFIAHYCGCFFFLVSDIEKHYGVDQTWVEIYGLDVASLKEQYITSIYWAVITMITLGYGDYVPKTLYEKIFVIFITLISCGVFAYSINQIGNIITQMTKKKSQFQLKISQIMGYLKERGIESNMLMKIKQNFAYLQRESEKDMEVHNIIQTQLSKSLRKEVFREMYVQLLKGCKTFNLNFSDQFLKHLAPHLKEKKFSPEEIIYEQDTPNQNLYFILRGKVQIYLDLEGQKRQIKVLSKNEVFGEQPFFSQNTSNHSAISLNVVQVVYINLADFLAAINNFQSDFETYSMMKDKLNLYSTSKRLGIRCYSCGQFQHSIEDCPFVHFIPNKEKILINHNIEFKQERNPINHNRRIYIKHEKAILVQKQIQEEIINFVIEHNLYENLNELMQILRNQEIIFDLNQLANKDEQEDKDLNYKSSLTQKSLQVLYPKMNNDQQQTEGNMQSDSNTPTTKPKMLNSVTRGGSSQFSQQQQSRKMKRTQTSQTGRSDSLAFLGPSSSKQISENIHYPTTLERVESRKKSNNHVSYLNSQLLRESSRKIILEEIIESQKFIQQQHQQQQHQQSVNSLLYTSHSNNINSVNSQIISSQNQNILNSNSNNSQSIQTTFVQSSQNASLKAHGPNSGSIVSPIKNSAKNVDPQYDQYNRLVYNNNRSQSESFSQKNKKMVSSVTSLSQKHRNTNTTSSEKRKQKEGIDDMFMQQLLKATMQKSNISNLNLGQIPLIPQQTQLQLQFENINGVEQLNFTTYDLHNFEKMNKYEVFFPHNNYLICIGHYNSFIRNKSDLSRMNSSQVQRERIKQIRLSMFMGKANHRLLTQTSQKLSKLKSKSQYFTKN